MNMEVFVGRLCREVEKRFGKERRIKVMTNNDSMEPGMQIMDKGDITLTTECLNGLLEAYMAGIPLKRIARELLNDRRTIREGHLGISYFIPFEAAKDRICYRLLNRDSNKKLLDEMPYVSFLDLAICFYYAGDGEGIGEATQIHNAHMKKWGTDAAELLEMARRNTQKLFPWECESLEVILEGEQQEEDMTKGALPSRPKWYERKIPMGILGNRQKQYGAACILYPEVLDRLAQEAGNALYILPSSVHEVILLPDTGGHSAQKLKVTINVINMGLLAPEEVLSNSLYYYSRLERQIRIL